MSLLTHFFQYFYFRHIDQEEYILSSNIINDSTGARPNFVENDLNESGNRPAPIAANEEGLISQKQ